MDTCKFVHYTIDDSIDTVLGDSTDSETESADKQTNVHEKMVVIDEDKSLMAADSGAPYERVLHPPQYVKCDLRFFNFSVLGM